MAYVVAFNKESEKAVIYEMDHEDRMNAIVVDGMPTLQDLDNFYEQKRINDLIHSRRGREVNLAFESLIDMASNAGPVEHRDNRLRDLKLYRVLSTIIELYVYRRTGCESVSLRRDICRISNEKKSWAWELMYRSIKYSGIRAIATWIHAMNDEVGLELNTLSHSEIFQPDVYPESAESTVIGEEVINVEKASNVTLTTARESSITQTSAPSIKWSKFVSNDVVDDYATITDRWYTLGSFTWDNTQRQSQIIYRIGDRTPILPLDIVYNGMEVPCDMPNLIPFKVHTYWRGDIEIKIQVNSNKFQIGQLMAAFYYQSDLNENIYDKMNIFSMSQMDHVVIQASASNEATLYVPYASMYPMLPTRKVPTADSSASILNLGTLWIMVQNQLSSTATGPKKCKGSVLIRFVNSEFTGLSHGSFAVKPEAGLLQPIVKSAMNVVQQVAADFNRDNPPDIAPPKYLVPTASHSWSTGTNDVDPIHMLRLDPTGQTYHNLDKQVNNETSIANVVSKFGLVDIIPWMSEKSNKGKRGDVLYKLPAAPDIMNQREGGGETASYVLSPVGIVASLFHQWRGTLEFKIQIVASQFHTGRIMVGYIPGYTGDTPTINQLKASPHAIFDLQEQREFSYEVPYISYKPWWTRQQTGNYPIAASPAPSTFCILIYNELIVMETVPDFVFINIYIRAGRSFEVSIPVQPSISLSWHKDFVYPAEDKTGAIDGYSPYYYGWWVGLNNSKTLCGRWGTLSEEIAEMRELQRNLMPRQYMYYQLDPSVVKRNYPDAVFKHDNMRTIPSYAIIHQSGHGFAIIVPFIEEVSCQTVAKAIYIDKKSLSDPDLQRHCMTSDYFLPGNYSTGNPSWVVLIRTEATQRRVPRADVEWVEHESDEQSTVVDLALMDTLASTNNGKLFYGESFVDLKDLGRRYQMYGQVQIASLVKANLNKCAFSFHALPQGLIPSIGTADNPNELFNRCREGPIPLIASLFRYYRGSLRFRICFPPDIIAKVWIQHRPDRKYNTRQDRSIRLCHSIDTAQGVFNHGYAYYIQYTNINGIVEFEVPFYNNTISNILQLPKISDDIFSWGVSLGQILVGIEWIGDISTHQGKWISIYYALADDMHFSQWIGGARYLKLDDNATAVPEAGEEETIPNVTLLTQHERKEDKVCISEGKWWYSPVESLKEEVKSTATSCLNDTFAEVKTEISSVLDKIYGEMGKAIDSVDKPTIAAILGNLMHIAVNPLITTIATSVVNILISIGIVGVTMIASASKIVTRFFESLRGYMAPKPQDMPMSIQAMPESDDCGERDRDAEAAGWCSLIYNGLLSMLNISMKKPKTWAQWQEVIVKDFSNSTRGANQVFLFIRNTMKCIRKMLDYILGRSNTDYNLLQVLESDPEVLKAWCKEVLFLTDPTVRREMFGQANYADRVYDAQLFGQTLIGDIASELRTAHNSAAIAKLFDKVTLLKDDLLEAGEHPHVRKMPFTIYVHGESGIGKSYLSTALGVALLKEIRYQTKYGLKCTLNAQSDYWDQCNHQPILEIDDLWAVSTPGALEKQLLTVFQVCSPIVLSPPKAALEEKKMRYNPEIFYINSNYDFPVYNDVLKEALWRRRDILIKAEKSMTKVKGCPHCYAGKTIEEAGPSWLADFHHLQFSIAQNVRDDKTLYDGPYTYDQFLKIVKDRFIANRERERINFTNRVLEHESLQVPIDDDDVDSGILDRFNAIQSKRKFEYSKFYHRTLKNDVNSFIAQCQESIICKYKNLSSIDIKSVIDKIKYWTYMSECEDHVIPWIDGKPCILPEAPATTSPYAKIKNLLQDEGSISRYHESLEDIELIQLRSLVDENIISEREYTKTISDLQKVHDSGFILNAVLEYYRVSIRKMYAIDANLVSTVPKIIDFILSHAAADKGVHYCMHFCSYADDSVLANKEIVFSFDGEDYVISSKCQVKKNLERCIFLSKYIEYLWFDRWLKKHPSHRLAYSRNNVKHLPLYLSTDNIREILVPDGIIKQLYLWLSIRWKEQLSPVVSRIFWWVKSAWPKICSVLLSIGVFSAVAAPVFRHTTAVEKQTAMQALDFPMHTEMYKHGEREWTRLVNDPKSNPIFPENTVYSTGAPNIVSTVTSRPPVLIRSEASQQSEHVSSLIKNNTVIMRFYYENEGVMDSFRCLVLRSRQVLVLRHYLEIAKARKDKITRQSLIFDHNSAQRTNGCELNIDWFSLTGIHFNNTLGNNTFDSNYIVLELPGSIPEFKSLEKFICPWNEWNSIGRSGTLVVGASTIHKDLPIQWVDYMPMCINSKGPTSRVVMTKCFRYPIHGAGMCGSILLCNNKEKPIIGMHVAGVDGVNGYGLAEPLFREIISDIPVLEDRPQINIIEPVLLNPDESDVNLGKMLYNIGCVDKKDAQHQNGKSMIKPSIIQGVFEVRTEPNPLSINDPRLPKSKQSPLELGCEKHGLPNLAIEDDILKLAEDHLCNKILSKVIPLRSKVGVLSEQVAVCGEVDIPEYNALSFGTSAGFPLSKYKPSSESGKRFLFDMDETAQGYKLKNFHPKLRSLLDVTNQMRKRNIKPMTVFSDCLKDTTLPKEKCRILGKTRIFSISPVQYTIPFRQYNLDFMAAYRRARFDVNHAIGININSLEWTDLATRLQSKGPKLVTGDYSNYGPSLNLECVEAACRIILAWYKKYGSTDEETKVRAILLQELVSAYHLCGNLIYRVPCGIPSGSPITDILNSLVGNLYIYCSWIGITKKSLNEYERHCYEIVYGDDLIMNISNEIAPIFNTVSMGKWFGKYFIKFTDADKTGTLIEYNDISTATFLKHSFVSHPYRPYVIMARLDPISVEGCANWIKCDKKSNPKLATQINAVMCCQLSFGHGPEYFNFVRSKLQASLQDKNIFQPLPTWEELDRRIYDTPESKVVNYDIDDYYIIDN